MLYSYPIAIKRFSQESGEAGVFEGLASTPGRDRHGDVMESGAFAESVSALNSGKRRIPLLFDHNASDQIGGINTAEETAEGLFVTGQIVPGTPSADRVHALAKASAISLSVGFMPVEHERMPDSRGQRYKRVDLVEISAVSHPANRESRILSIKNLDLASPDQFERLFRDLDVPGRLAKKLTLACLDVLDSEKRHDPGQLAELKAALAGTLKTFQSR